MQKYIGEVDKLSFEQLRELVAKDMNEYIGTKKLSIKMLSSDRKPKSDDDESLKDVISA